VKKIEFQHSDITRRWGESKLVDYCADIPLAIKGRGLVQSMKSGGEPGRDVGCEGGSKELIGKLRRISPKKR